MRFLIGTHFAVGHQKFMLPIAQKLVDRGHEVWWYTGRAYQSQIESVGATYVPMQHSPDYSQVSHDQAFEGRDKLGFFAGVNWDMKHIFIKNGTAQLKDLSETLKAFPADVILTDTGFYGAQFLYERGGPPWATISAGPLTISSRDTAPFGPGIQPAASPLGRLRSPLLHMRRAESRL
jgi:UDP:flavonoid glycosyltransferase YjiC (YdhE family)